ncbi:hypothetical protein FQA39_LY04679 [Lamprigera yunnana]|nr:hypothetical protein FQA39_LY04679 [Lamprigera yunnana]
MNNSTNSSKSNKSLFEETYVTVLLLVGVLVLQIIGIVMYCMDKRAARKRRQEVRKENENAFEITQSLSTIRPPKKRNNSQDADPDTTTALLPPSTAQASYSTNVKITSIMDQEHGHPHKIIFIIVLIVGVILLQIVGFLLCCKDRWKAKKKAKKGIALHPLNIASSKQTAEVTKRLIVKESEGTTSVEAVDEEACVALLGTKVKNEQITSLLVDNDNEIHIHTHIIKVKHINH